MQGAREYAELFGGSGQYGKFYIETGSHARGRTFRIWILKSARTLTSTEDVHISKVEGVEVYGVVSGNPGWTEAYGWKHRGAWIKDFNEIVRKKKTEALQKKEKETVSELKKATKEANRVTEILDGY